MKRILFVAIFAFSCWTSKAQNTTIAEGVEKNVMGFQAGFFGFDAYNEFKLTSIIALRADLSLYGGIFYENTDDFITPIDYFNENSIALTPIINLQPKVYYNIKGRAKRGKNIRNNGSNYFSLNIKYVPNWFVISERNITPITQLYFVPTFGIRRNFAKNFNYEFKAGLGGGVAYLKNQTIGLEFFELSFKIGYDF